MESLDEPKINICLNIIIFFLPVECLCACVCVYIYHRCQVETFYFQKRYFSGKGTIFFK